MSKQSDYWHEREVEWKNSRKSSEKQYEKKVQEIYQSQLDSIETQIESFFSKYATSEGITMAEAKKKASEIDIEKYKRKAEKYVKEKNFSSEARKEMKLYNMAMKVNRLELLKANIGLDLVSGADELKDYTGQVLQGEVLERIKHDSSILGDTVINNSEFAKTVADSSYMNATFSDRIWAQQDQLKNSLTNILSNALIQGKNARTFIPQVRKQFGVSSKQAERLLRTEIARVQTQAQAENYEELGLDEYEYIACGLKDCCEICKALDGQVFKVKDMECGKNAPPMHPNCHCATAPHIDRQEFNKWLDEKEANQTDLSYDEWKESNSSNSTNEKVKKYLSYIDKGYSIYTPKDLNDIQCIEKAYEQAIKNASDIKNVKIKDGYHTWDVLPLKEQIKQNGNSADLYLAHSGKYGGWYKIGETKTTVKFVSSSDYKKGILDYPLTVEKEEYVEEKERNLKYQMERTLSEIKKDALYKIAKSDKLKVTRKTSESELKTAIQNSGSESLIKKAKKYNLL